ncbi:cadmium-translocating P-type ATPase [Rhodobacteraceae bacterium N5(2021)]|uniref:Cadmium-translocating P-type ATPase n=1 Tax=Gymnodinialimonas phycosphaerae TaxID=2841589 RepID=A0A975TT50_9RHOB|nr:heavy metal translocating P-type ATPase [Gymnodinialimonas phycosphaerae]MBY4893715.1 cadmium-translocating P-type ATPase [Gymnodinialimonas phycosphaerae]
MTAFADPARPSACPACDVAPLAEQIAGSAPTEARLMLAVPGIHCAGCISGVERALQALPGVHDARVNLTLRRVAVEADLDVDVDTLCAVLTEAGYEAHELDPGVLAATEVDARGRALLMRLAVAVFAMMNVMLLSVAVWSGAEGVTRDMMHWISAAIAIPAVIFTGQPFYSSALQALKAGRLNMDVPISLAIILAVGTSLYETMLSGEHAYFDAAIALCTFLLAGRYLDHRTRANARSAAQELAALEVPRALRLNGQVTETVGVADLAPGDLVRVLPGGRIPVDGVVTEGTTELDRSLMTGETLPAAAAPGDAVHAGESNLTGPITVEVQAAGRDTDLARITDLIAVAEAGRNNYTSLADAAAKLYAPGVHIISALAAIGWFVATWDLRVALNIAAAVLIITCPCALGLAVPAVTTAASARLFRKGLLIKNGTALERLAQVDTVVFDKTGTLTDGAPEPMGLDQFDAQTGGIALALSQGSAHPLAAAIARELTAQGVRPVQVDDIREQPGFGVEGLWEGKPVRLGRAAWVGGGEAVGTTATYLRIGEAPAQAITFTDTLREGAAELVAGLQAQGKRVVLVSGDVEAAVTRFAARIGIEEVIFEAHPAAKAEAIAALSAEGRRVLMVGDGMNDTAALAAADVSISPASALEAARAASDMVLTGGSLAPILDAMATAVSARRRIKENFTIASVYNLLAVPLAVAGLCSPLIAALAMSSSSLTVSLNALRLR